MSGAPRGLVFGCGSNVVDLFFRIKRLPSAGDKGYFATNQVLSDRIVGGTWLCHRSLRRAHGWLSIAGVTLNHLAWARTLGVPTALLAAQGNDDNGVTIRQKLDALGVETRHIAVDEDFTTSVSHVLVDNAAERAILMAPASTSLLNGPTMQQLFGSAIKGASMFTTEVSQLPLSGARWMLDQARAAGVPSCLDVDVPVEIAVGEAALGSAEELTELLQQPTLLKLTRLAADSIFRLVSPGDRLITESLEMAAQQIAGAAGVDLCVITDGSRGSALALGSGQATTHVPVYQGVALVDSTGAGDAYFGGLVACLHAFGTPSSVAELQRMGKIASAAGAACCEVLGALPVPGVSEKRAAELCPELAGLLQPASPPQHKSESSGPKSRILEVFAESLQADANAVSDVEAHARESSEHTGAIASLLEASGNCRVSNKNTLFVSGVGKSGYVAQRVSASLRSVGVRSMFVHGVEFGHGDLGAVAADDVVLIFSHSGNTQELRPAVRHLISRGAKLFVVTNNSGCHLGELGASVIAYSSSVADLQGCIPTRSILAQEAIGNALVSCFAPGKDEFKRNHPAGAIHEER
jgi:sugar/nucleoside kinase (ribokinase family)/D-arabinose 5-phosphate isomerase GutQ